MIKNKYFPFVAIVGQKKIKKALVLNAINKNIRGVLISGQKGTAKSTMVRSLYELLDEKVINLPLNITEDRLVGSLDMTSAIKDGCRKLEKGLLCSKENAVIYIDEVNLLNNHIVSILTETISLEQNYVERDGVSHSNAVDISLIGSMNPEEGLLRPQFLDRFGLFVEAKSEMDEMSRIEVIKRTIAFQDHPQLFVDEWEKQSIKLKNKILSARERLDRVQVSEGVLLYGVNLVSVANCQGHRADILLIETAKAIAAYEFRSRITTQDVDEAARYVLPHRMRETIQDPIREASNQINEEQRGNDVEKTDDNHQNNHHDDQNGLNKAENQEETDELEMHVALDFTNREKQKSLGTGKRSKVISQNKIGRYEKNRIPKEKSIDIAFDATIRQAALKQKHREKNGLAISVKKEDIREKIKEKHTGAILIFAVDASGSMGARKRMAAVKGAVMSMLNDAYQKRDQIGIVAFRDQQAEVILNITRSVDLAQKCLKKLPTGGKTPLASGLERSLHLIRTEKIKSSDALIYFVLISDGRANVSLNTNDAFNDAKEMAKQIRNENVESLIIDTESGFIRYGIAKEISNIMDGKYIEMESITPMEVKSYIKDLINIK